MQTPAVVLTVVLGVRDGLKATWSKKERSEKIIIADIAT